MRQAPLPFAILLCLSAAAHAQGRTDVVTLGNGDRITGEIVSLEHGRLQFKTDDAGTLYLEWEKLVSVIAAARVVEVITGDAVGRVAQRPHEAANPIGIR